MTRPLRSCFSRAARRWFVPVLLVGALSTPSVLANDPTQAADRHFSRGLAAAGAGKMTVAASEFERAYEAAPHYSVLYNLGLVYAALERNADAVRVLRRYLLEGGEKVSRNRRREVEAIIEERRGALAHATVRVQPADAVVRLDGRTLESAELTGTLEIDPGRHLLFVQREGHVPQAFPFEAAAGDAVNVELTLTQVAQGEMRSSEMVPLVVECAIPEVEVAIDGEVVHSGALGVPRVVSAGGHRIRFARPGYGVDERMVEVREWRRVDCRMRPLDPLPAALSADLELELPTGARVFVDGATFEGGRLPYGRHQVTVVHDDYVTWQRDIDLKKGDTIRLAPPLVATREHRLLQESIAARRTWAVVSGGVGVALLTGGAVLYALNGERYEDWQADNAAFSRREAPQSELKREAADLQGRAASIQRLDDIALGLGLLGVVSLGAGIGLYMTTPSVGADESFRVSARGLSELSFSTVW